METSGRVWAGRVVHALTYAVVVDAVAWCLSALAGLALGAPLTGAKYGLFVVGWLAVGYGAWVARPTARWKSDEDAETGESIGKRARTRFQRAVFSLPPADRFELGPTERVPSGPLVLLSGVAMLLTSFLMEAALGVGG